MNAYIDAAKAILFNEYMRKFSKINGRRNYCIILETNYKNAYMGNYGAMKRRGYLAPISITYMAKAGICWLYYTYKKDYNDAIKEIQNNNYNINMIY